MVQGRFGVESVACPGGGVTSSRNQSRPAGKANGIAATKRKSAAA